MSSYLVSQPLPTIKDLQAQIEALQGQITRFGGNPLIAVAYQGALAHKQALLNALLHPDQVPGVPPAPAAPPTLAPRPQTPRIGLSDLVIAPRTQSPTIPPPSATAYNGGLIPVRGY